MMGAPELPRTNGSGADGTPKNCCSSTEQEREPRRRGRPSFLRSGVLCRGTEERDQLSADQEADDGHDRFERPEGERQLPAPGPAEVDHAERERGAHVVQRDQPPKAASSSIGLRPAAY